MTARIWQYEDGDQEIEVYCPRHGIMPVTRETAAEVALTHDYCSVISRPPAAEAALAAKKYRNDETTEATA